MGWKAGQKLVDILRGKKKLLKTEQHAIKKIPKHLKSKYTLEGKIPVLDCYIDEISNNNSILVYTKSDYENVLKQISENTFKYYDTCGTLDYIYQALEKYDISGKTICVFGSTFINCDAIALSRGAEFIYIVEYNKIISEHEKVKAISYEEYLKSGIKCDFAFSISSFEHDGLGRYGDPINPTGDFEAMRLAKKMLKKNGIMFFAVPIGPDALVWNAHRIYGKIRLPMLIDGWEMIDSFGLNDNMFNGEPGEHYQPVLVLKNI